MKREIVIIKDSVSCSRSVASVVDIVQLWLQGIGPGNWVLKLEKKKVQRSISQNALMWIWFEAIAQEWTDASGRSYTKENVHDYFCQLFLPVTAPNGHNMPGSTSGLNVDRMADFLNKVHAHAASEWGITLLSPEDRMFYDWRNQYE